MSTLPLQAKILAAHEAPRAEDERARLLERRERELQVARAELEAREKQLAISSRYRSEFLANMSHELRTPLNSVLILSRLLGDNVDANLTEKQVSFARTIHTSGTDLLALINDVIDLSRVEAGTLMLELDELSLEDMCTQLRQGFAQLARERGIELVVEVAHGVPRTIFIDGRRLQQALKNLLLNALKFTERGRVTLTVRTADAGGAQSRGPEGARPDIVFAVRDTGIGIPEDQRATIFEPFHHSDGKPIRGRRGSGLGLTLVRDFARLLGGDASLEASGPLGSTFALRVPWRRSPDSMPPPASEPALMPSAGADRDAATAASHPLLLLASGDAGVARVLRPIAERAGLDIVTRARPEASLVVGAPPLGIVLDLRPVGLEGWISLDQLRRDLGMRQVPVFALTAPCDRRAAQRLGAFVLEAATEREMEWVAREVSWLAPQRPRKLLVCGFESAPSVSSRRAGLGVVGRGAPRPNAGRG